MRKFIAIGVATLTAVLLAAPVVRAGIVDLLTFEAAVDAAQAVDPTLQQPANDGKHDFAVGGFERPVGSHAGFSAQSGPNGEAPKGHLSSTSDDFRVKERYDVVCLAVAGPNASIGLAPTNSPPSNAGTPRILRVFDSQMPGGMGDLFTFYITDPMQCAQFLAMPALNMPLKGNILVHDEP